MSQTALPDSPAADTPNAGDDQTILELHRVSKSFHMRKQHVEALKNVDFAAKVGKVTGLIGPDAAGKTTLMRMVAGIMTPDEGDIRVLGIDVVHEPLTVQATICYMPQRFGLYEDLTVLENLNLYADLQAVPKDVREERYDKLLDMMGMLPFKARLAGKLSGGMKQKLGLSCTLVRSPQLLLLDEPTVGVDPVSRRELWEIVYRLVAEEGLSVLLSTSYLDEAERCDEVAMLYEGQLLGQGPPKTFRDRVAGQTFAVSVEGIKLRHAQQRIEGQPNVIDALIDGDFVRLVMAKGVQPDPAVLLPDVKNVSIKPVEPCFEDSFVAILREQEAHEQKGEKPSFQVHHEASSSKTNPISVEDLKRRFGDFYAVKGISFEVQRGEIFGLLGANGAGKTTTFRMLCGLLPVTEGQVRVAGADLRYAAAAARARIGYMSQKFSLYATLSVMDNLRFFSSAYNLVKKTRVQRIGWVLDMFELRDVADATSGDLPLGYKQRLAMACSLMHDPDILFLDEPTSGVDPLARRDFWSRINALADEGVTIMVTTHFMAEAEYCDRLAIMVAGEILTIGTPKEVRLGARTEDNPDPSMEDAFIKLVQRKDKPAAT